MYSITAYTRQRAKEIGVDVKPSTKKGKKIDVYKNGKFIASLGQAGAGDFPHYLAEKGVEYAEERRRLYRLRHTKDTVGEVLALHLLW
jgi:hypothetical protein